jgi:hypothetical protein
MICCLVATAFSSAAWAWYFELDSKFEVRPKSVINWFTTAPPATRENILPLVRYPAARREPPSAPTAVTFKLA